MNKHTYEKLEFFKLKEEVKSFCSSDLGRELINNLNPIANLKGVKSRLSETTEARKLMDISGSLDLRGIHDIKLIIEKIENDNVLTLEQLVNVAAFIRGCDKIKRYMNDKEFYAPTLYSYSLGLEIFLDIEEEIEVCIRNNKIVDSASTNLKNIRRHILNTEEKIKDGINKFIKDKKNKEYIQDSFVTRKNNRLTVPIKATYKNKVDGVVIESNIKTAFIEPKSVERFTNKLNILQVDELNEEYIILANLTNLVYEIKHSLKRNMEIIAHYDMVFAKGKYSKSINACEPKVNEHGYINIISGKHPLLEGKVVPLNIKIGEDYRSLIITGPNAGGKTVVLKTIGILTLAVQSGFHIPCDEKTEISIFEKIFCDIGDDQSLENSLSTFSSHVKNLSNIINKTNKSSLVLLDEIGSGTEPSEGAALAIAILENLYYKGAITVATTHYNEIKDYSKQHSDFENAAMKFNKETLEPEYKIIVGKSGESNALWISEKMGITDKILKQAKKYMSDKNYKVDKIDDIKVRKYKEEVKINNYNYVKGDRVYINKLKKTGIVYDSIDKENNVDVFIEGKYQKVNYKLLKLEEKAVNLYPDDYDLETLFTSYKDRKLDWDIKRGSKKALKKIRKEQIKNKIKE